MIQQLVYDPQTIAQRVNQLGTAITRDYADKTPMLIGGLNSAVVFMADLTRAAPIPLEVDFIAVSHFEPSESVRFEKDTSAAVHGRHILLVEPVIDTGLTVQYVMRTLKEQGTGVH